MNALFDDYVLVKYRAVYLRAGAYHAVLHDYRIFDDRAFADRYAAEYYRVLDVTFDQTAVSEQGV